MSGRLAHRHASCGYCHKASYDPDQAIISAHPVRPVRLLARAPDAQPAARAFAQDAVLDLTLHTGAAGQPGNDKALMRSAAPAAGCVPGLPGRDREVVREPGSGAEHRGHERIIHPLREHVEDLGVRRGLPVPREGRRNAASLWPAAAGIG
jgi:hypothetical protein